MIVKIWRNIWSDQYLQAALQIQIENNWAKTYLTIILLYLTFMCAPQYKNTKYKSNSIIQLFKICMRGGIVTCMFSYASSNCLPGWIHDHIGCISPLCIFKCVLKWMRERMHNHTGCIWKHTVEKSLTSATSVSMHPIEHPIWEHIWKPTAEKNQTNAACAIMHALYFVFMFKDYGFTLLSKSFAACIAFERLLTCVSPHVVM